MARPYELSTTDMRSRLDEMIDITFSDLQSQFLTMPRGEHYIEYLKFSRAYETLKHATSEFTDITEATLWGALEADSLCFIVIRSILGLSPPEWADLAGAETTSDVSQDAARRLDMHSRTNTDYFKSMRETGKSVHLPRTSALLREAVSMLTTGVPSNIEASFVHRLDKVDTRDGLSSIQRAATENVPYSALLYERFLGRPFASHRDSISELVGDVMENAVEELLVRSGVSYRRTGRAEKVPGFEQAPDFLIPDEFSPRVVIEAKITNDDGTARDKVARILRLGRILEDRGSSGRPEFELVACIDGRGFGVRRNDMKDILLVTSGKTFTLNTLPDLIAHTQIARLAGG